MAERTVTIVNRLGLHARAAARFVNETSGFASDVTVVRNGHEVNGKSIMGVMMLAAGQGSTITLRAEGDDDEAALDAITALITDRFGEDE